MSLPLAKTGVSGNEQEVCIPELVATFPVVPTLLPPEELQASVDGECLLVNGRLLDGPGRSVGSVRLSTGIYNNKRKINNLNQDRKLSLFLTFENSLIMRTEKYSRMVDKCKFTETCNHYYDIISALSN